MARYALRGSAGDPKTEWGPPSDPRFFLAAWIAPHPGVDHRRGRGWVGEVTGDFFRVFYSDGRRDRYVKKKDFEFVLFEKDYRDDLPHTYVVASDTKAFEQVLIALPYAVQGGLVTQQEGATAQRVMSKTAADLEAIRSWLQKNLVTVRLDNKKAQEDANRIACIYNMVDLLGVSPDVAAVMCQKGWWKKVLIVGGLVLAGLVLLPSILRTVQIVREIRSASGRK